MNYLVIRFGFGRYEIKDHLGNVRTVISDIKNIYPLNSVPSGSSSTWTYLADIRNISNMYPYGKSYPATATYSADDDYRYGFNGMEKAKEVDDNTNHTHFRNLDLDFGRWWSPDPLESSMPYQSPYVLMSRDPIARIDPNGDTDYEVNKEDGKIINIIENDKDDNVYIVKEDKDGEFARVDDESVKFELGTITGVNEPDYHDESLTLFSITGENESKKLFEFLSQKTKVEWSYGKIGLRKNDKNIVGTSSNAEETYVGTYLRIHNYHIREMYHNHPSGVPNPSKGDKNAAKEYYKLNPEIKLGVYVIGGGYFNYNSNGFTGEGWDRYFKFYGIEEIEVNPKNGIKK